MAPDPGSVADGERKLVTALFVDIVGSTILEQDLDPEEARAIIDPALQLMIQAVRRYDGYVVQSTGDYSPCLVRRSRTKARASWSRAILRFARWALRASRA